MSGDLGALAVSRRSKQRLMTQRRLGILAAIGGVAWIIGVALALILPVDEFGDHDNTVAVISLAIGASLIGIVLGRLGTRPGIRSRTSLAIGLAGIVLGLTVAMGWPWFMVFLIGYPILVLLGAVRGFLAGTLPGWSVAVIGSSTGLAVVGLLGLPELFGDGSGFALFALIGVAGLVLAVVALRIPGVTASTRPTEVPA
jgi:carbon starvation protein CstA